MNDRSIMMKNAINKPSAHDFAKAIFKNTITCQRLINGTLDSINKGEGDIERSKIFLEATESTAHLIMVNLLKVVQQYVNNSHDEDIVKLVDQGDIEGLKLMDDFMNGQKRFFDKHKDVLEKNK
jgi:hypothetical protein